MNDRTRLVISRRHKQVVWVGQAKITILKKHGRNELAEVVIEAPRDINIVRAERLTAADSRSKISALPFGGVS